MQDYQELYKDSNNRERAREHVSPQNNVITGLGKKGLWKETSHLNGIKEQNQEGWTFSVLEALNIIKINTINSWDKKRWNLE